MSKESHGLYKEKLRSNLQFLLFVGVFCIFLVIGVSRHFLTQVRNEEDHGLVMAIEKLQAIFNRINQSAHIVSFRGKKAPINFLTVRSFAGSSVGPLQLAHPDLWEGPYLTEPFEVQGIECQLVATKKGIYIVPGDGVRLANGKIIGTTLKFANDTDIDAMMIDPAQLLSWSSKPLAAKLTVTPKPRDIVRREVRSNELAHIADVYEEDDPATY